MLDTRLSISRPASPVSLIASHFWARYLTCQEDSLSWRYRIPVSKIQSSTTTARPRCCQQLKLSIVMNCSSRVETPRYGDTHLLLQRQCMVQRNAPGQFPGSSPRSQPIRLIIISCQPRCRQLSSPRQVSLICSPPSQGSIARRLVSCFLEVDIVNIPSSE